MNYPFRKKTPVGRSLCLMLVLLLTIGSLSGCSLLSSVNPTEPSTDPTESTPSISIEPSTEPSTVPTVPPTTVAPKENVAIVKEQLSLRSNPSSGSKVKGQLDAGDEVEVTRLDFVGSVQWAYVYSETLGTPGWIVAEMLDLSNVHLDTSSTITPASTDPTITPPTQSTIPTTPTTPTAPTNIDPVTGNGTGTANPANGKQGVVTASELNIRASADKNADRKGSYKYGDRITVLESSNGWGRTDKGWVSLTYVYMDGDTGKNTASGTVAATQLNVRTGPGKNYDRVKTLAQNERVQILEQIKVGTTAWGYTSGGWVSMEYIRLDSGTNIGGTGTGTGTATGNATVTGSTVYVRSGAGTNYPAVGTVTSGQSITILETTTGSDGYQWGRTSQGWVCMTYVSLNAGTIVGGTGTGTGTGTTTGNATVTGTTVHIRSGAGTNYPSVGSVSMGQSISILETTVGTDGNQWGRTNLGWISMAYVRMN